MELQQQRIDKESLEKQLKEAQSQVKSKSDALEKARIKATQLESQVSVTDQTIQMLKQEISNKKKDLETSRQYEIQERKLKEELQDKLNQQLGQQTAKDQKDYEISKLNNQIVEYKVQVNQLKKERKAMIDEYKAKYNQSTSKHDNSVKQMKLDFEDEIKNLKNRVKSLQIELDMERNSMTGQEEMMHSLIHSISMKFHEAKTMQQAKKQPPKAPSYLEQRAKQAYQGN